MQSKKLHQYSVKAKIEEGTPNNSYTWVHRKASLTVEEKNN